jgi:hypothetical protein
MVKDKLISGKLEDFYNQSSEEDRLSFGLGPWEFERNKELIQRHLPQDKATIVDVGGGTGKYSEWLAGMGHEANLINLELFAVEGIVWLDKNWFTSRSDQTKFDHLLSIARLTEQDPNLVAISPHMMIAGIRQRAEGQEGRKERLKAQGASNKQVVIIKY